MSASYEIIKRALQEERFVALYPAVIRTVGGINEAIMLQQIMYWSDRNERTNGEGWFWKTGEEWERETTLTRNQQELARKRLTERGLIEVIRQGVPARLWFRARFEAIAVSLGADSSSLLETSKLDSGFDRFSFQETSKLDCRKPENILIDKTTTDTLTPLPPKAPAKAPHPLPDDWKPGEAALAWAQTKGYAPAFIERETEKMTLFFWAKGQQKYTDWNRAWQKWMNTAAEREPGKAFSVGAAPRPRHRIDGTDWSTVPEGEY